MRNRIIQTIWFKPIKGDVHKHLRLAYVSAKSIKEQGYELVLYTDQPCVFKDFPYDDVRYVDMKDYNPRLFSTVKYISLSQEPLGTIHLDYDIILNKPCINCNGQSDFIVQSREHFLYEKEKEFLYKNYVPKLIGEFGLSDYPFNVGVIGFFNQKLWDLFLANFLDAVEHYKNIQIPEDVNLDLLFEQSFLSRLCEAKKYSPSFIWEYPRVKCVNGDHFVENKALGFSHYWGNSKFNDDIIVRYGSTI